uniref:Uncharacterized protein n=1 Tax=Arundo donax TaxID=35708 RepID=A0A0A9CAQ6_ARUDO
MVQQTMTAEKSLEEDIPLCEVGNFKIQKHRKLCSGRGGKASGTGEKRTGGLVGWCEAGVGRGGGRRGGAGGGRGVRHWWQWKELDWQDQVAAS